MASFTLFISRPQVFMSSDLRGHFLTLASIGRMCDPFAQMGSDKTSFDYMVGKYNFEDRNDGNGNSL